MYKKSVHLMSFLVVLSLFAPAASAANLRPLLRPTRATSIYAMNAMRQPVRVHISISASRVFYQPNIPDISRKVNRAVITQLERRRIARAKAAAKPIIFRGTQLTELQEGERILLGAVYDSKGHFIASYSDTYPDGSPIPLTQVEQGMPGYDIARVIFVLRKVENGARIDRIIDYHLKTQEIKTPETKSFRAR